MPNSSLDKREFLLRKDKLFRNAKSRAVAVPQLPNSLSRLKRTTARSKVLLVPAGHQAGTSLGDGDRRPQMPMLHMRGRFLRQTRTRVLFRHISGFPSRWEILLYSLEGGEPGRSRAGHPAASSTVGRWRKG